ncbi:MAG: hypothetical protein WCV58_04525 [Patescibacteria group bacterium]
MQKILASLIVVATILMLPLTVLMSTGQAQAAYSSGYIISDAEFTNWSILDENGIQAFLNTKGGTRLRTFSENGRSAAKIIADAARSNGINPFVILATIQKEESLVESNYNFDFRVNWAMGYAICDSCSLDDPNVVKYRGFTNQIDYATWQFKYNYSHYAANGSDWNVGKTMIIDGTAVRFGSKATSSLYRYTPHLHGNENFYNIYNSYKSFRYASKYIKGTAKTAATKSAAAANKLKIVNSKNKAGQPATGGTSYEAQYVTKVGASNLRPGQKLTIYAYLKNTGTTTWTNSGANPVYLGNSGPQDRSSAFTGGNTRWRMLSKTVLPGRVAVFSTQITAPAAGSYTEKFRPVAEGVTWFGDEATFTFNVR